MAVILCAAISLTCAGLLGLVMTQKKQAQRELVKEQQLEAINTAVLMASTEIIRQQGDNIFFKDVLVSTPHGNMTVSIRAEYEGRKWPLDRLQEVDPAVLGQYTSLGLDNLDIRATRHIDGSVEPTDDCVRSLFSSKGYADPKKALPKGVGAISGSAGHDGQVWRIRAVNGTRLQERYVRFLGDASRLFAVISVEDYAVNRMPTCSHTSARDIAVDSFRTLNRRVTRLMEKVNMFWERGGVDPGWHTAPGVGSVRNADSYRPGGWWFLPDWELDTSEYDVGPFKTRSSAIEHAEAMGQKTVSRVVRRFTGRLR